MKSLKIGVSRTTMWRHAKQNVAEYDELGMENPDDEHAQAVLSSSHINTLTEKDGAVNTTTGLFVTPMSRAVYVEYESHNEMSFDDSNRESDVEYFASDIGWRWLNSESESESEEELLLDADDNLKQELAKWSVDNGITQTATGFLLSILQKYHPSLPKDPRTLLKAPCKQPVKDIKGGEYCHIGLSHGLLHLLSFSPVSGDSLEIQINVDGLPLFKSSSMSLWPILCSVKNVTNREPFVIGVFCGKEKPGSAAEFLSDFVSETCELMKTGFCFGSKQFTVNIHSFVCDAPARAFMKGVKLHCGYSSCDKCTVHGEYAGRVIFTAVDAPLRTDVAFDQMLDEDHHVEPCPLNPLPVGFVSKFALDYMHMACLGVMRRLLIYWKGPVGPLHVRLNRQTICELSRRLILLASYIPTEFARKPRTLDDLLRWKATEFREFLLYLGPVVLNGVLPERLYNHYMILFVALRILASPNFAAKYNDYANNLLVNFVKDTQLLYGKEAMVYNVHCLIHLAADAKQFGSLDEFSAFPFENKLGQLKRLIRKPAHPLQQLLKRLQEEQHFQADQTHVDTQTLKLSCEHNSGPLLPTFKHVIQYRRVQTNQWILSLGEANSCVMVRGGVPALVQNIVKVDNKINLLCANFETVYDAFTDPLPSSKLTICKVKGEPSCLFAVPLTDVICKCVRLPVLDDCFSWVIMPLVHFGKTKA